jgi:hypothetical protein
MAKKKTTRKHKPLSLHVNTLEEIFEKYRKEIAKSIIDALAYAVPLKLREIDFAEVSFQNGMIVKLAMDSTEFESIIDKNILILEEFEDYETCANAVKIKEQLLDNKK